MRRTLAVAVVLTGLAVPLLAQMGAQPHGAQVADEALAKAFKANDVDAIMATYAPDAVLYPPGAMEQRGQAAIRAGFTQFLGGFRITDFTTSATRYETSGNLSTGSGLFTMSVTPKAGGAPLRWEGRFTSVARRVGGKWLLVSDHASLPQGPPQGPRPVSNPSR
jgi:ketosteroid isomerase-like protein